MSQISHFEKMFFWNENIFELALSKLELPVKVEIFADINVTDREK